MREWDWGDVVLFLCFFLALVFLVIGIVVLVDIGPVTHCVDSCVQGSSRPISECHEYCNERYAE